MYLYLTTKKKRELDMAGKNVFNDKDSVDISELASLNGDISPELIEQLQQKLTQEAQTLSGEEPTPPAFNENDDTTLFEEAPVQSTEQPIINESQQQEEPKTDVPEKKKDIKLDKNFDDNFIKKYKAKLNKQKAGETSATKTDEAETTISSAAFGDFQQNNEDIEKVSNGNITERALDKKQKEYNDSLDFLDGNVKYSKYVIYIDPQNVDFIDSLTVKERKNLINKILREQDDIAITKQRFQKAQTIIKHAIVAVLTIAISIPVIYYTINASLEASINNYRRSQSMFQTLYKQGGKIKSVR